MKTLKKLIFASLTLGIVVLGSCLNGNEYPPEPDIKFLSFTSTDSLNLFGQISNLLVLTFEFTDGDGDIGAEEGDTIINMFVSEYGILNKVQQSPTPLRYTIPSITQSGQNKSLKGEIDIKITLLPFFSYDSVLYDIYIVDRSGNKSNLITTPIIPL